MPEVATDAGDGVLAAWLVDEEARFDAAQTIAYVETDDELFSVEAGRPGLLLKTLVEPGTRVAPGTPIGVLGEPWERVEDVAAVLAELGVAGRQRQTTPSWFDASASSSPLPESPEPRSDVLSAAAATPLTVVAEMMPLEVEPLLADLPEEPRRGTHAAATEAPAQVPVQAQTTAQSTAQTTAQSTAEPATLQHHYLRARVRVDRLVALSEQLDRPDSGVTHLVVRAVAAAHRQVPQLAVAHLDDGVATGIPVSDPGRFGVEEAAPIIPAGQSAALAVGAVRDEPVIEGGVVVPGKALTLTLSVRPGRVDDVQAARWLAVLVALLERPEWLVD
jgi:pyruvate dehydrogenase E2 component (dihydrolipoamide acetyltransferase)